MLKLYDNGIYLVHGETICSCPEEAAQKSGITTTKEEAAKGTMAYGILKAHNQSDDMDQLRLKFDSMTSHDITYVGIIQTARASGMKRFPLPYVLTNCHNSLCAVGGTINEDDHNFALSAAHKYGGIYVPTNMANIHSYNRETMAGGGRMILGSDSHTRYGALGTMAVGEGGGELAKQLVGRTYDFARPGVIAIYLTGKPRPGIGPHDVALSICGAVYKNGYVKNKVMEFVGPGVANLPIEFRNAIDVMTTETTCWSSIWVTDEQTQRYFMVHGRPEAYKKLAPADVAYYDGCVYIDLDTVESTIAMPMHPSNTYTIHELQANAADILHAVQEEANKQIKGAKMDLDSKFHDGAVWVDQGEIAGCAGGTFDNICAAADILRGKSCGNGVFTLSIYPGSMPALAELYKNGRASDLVNAGAIMRECFCGPCFGAGDTPANGGFSIRHSTRNFPNREGAKPGDGQVSYVGLMDARSIAATALNGGILTGADELPDCPADPPVEPYTYDDSSYRARVYFGVGKPQPETELVFGPNIADWPSMSPLPENLVLPLASVITDPVTTTDELIPSGETSSLRSNPLKLSEFTLSRKDPAYVGRAKDVQAMEKARLADPADAALLAKLEGMLAPLKAAQPEVYAAVLGAGLKDTGIGSTIFALKPGDGSAREQAASCQKVLGGWANVAAEYATKRYRSNLINWGMLPFQLAGATPFGLGDYILIPNIREVLKGDLQNIPAYVLGEEVKPFALYMAPLTADERQILADGCLINFYKH